MHDQQPHQLIVAAPHAQHNWNRAHTPPRRDTTPQRTRALTTVGAATGAGVGTVGAGCMTSHDSVISDLHITPQWAPATGQWTLSTECIQPRQHRRTQTLTLITLGTTGAVGAQGIASHGSIRSSQPSRPHSTAPQCTRARQEPLEPVASPAATASACHHHHEQRAQSRTLTCAGVGVGEGAGAAAAVCIANHDTPSHPLTAAA
jgi:hypothetical protein